ncbi:MAG: EI24 domain-containing protein, partial [Bdellovibrionota bacterium]
MKNQAGGIIERFLNGFFIIFNGMTLITKNNDLKKWSIVPFLIGLLILIIGFALTILYIPSAIEWLIQQKMQVDGNKSGYFYYPLVFIAGLLFIILNVYLSYWFTQIFAAPVYSVLAEKTLVVTGSQVIKARSGSSVIFKMIMASIVKALFFSIIGTTLFLTTLFIPGLNILVSAFLFFVIATDSADYSLEILGYSFKERLKFYKRHFIEFFGLSMCVGLTLVIPGLILLIMPAAVVGS